MYCDYPANAATFPTPLNQRGMTCLSLKQKMLTTVPGKGSGADTESP
jgi:hypothetical protein